MLIWQQYIGYKIDKQNLRDLNGKTAFFMLSLRPEQLVIVIANNESSKF